MGILFSIFKHNAGNRNLPRYNQMNINVATWARIIKRNQPSEHHAPLTGSGSISSGSVSSGGPGGSVGRPSSISSTTRPLPLLNFPSSPASMSLPVTSSATPGSNSSSPPPPSTPTLDMASAAAAVAAEMSSKQPLEAPGEKPQPSGHVIHSAQRPLNIMLPSSTSAMSGNMSPMVTSPVTPTVTGMMVPIQFPPSGKKPAPPPPPRTTSVVNIIPVATPTVPPQRPVSSPPNSIEETKVRKTSTFLTNKVKERNAYDDINSHFFFAVSSFYLLMQNILCKKKGLHNLQERTCLLISCSLIY